MSVASRYLPIDEYCHVVLINIYSYITAMLVLFNILLPKDEIDD